MSEHDVTAWLLAWARGDATAGGRLMAAVYSELRQVARRRLRAERGGHSLTPTALVHEAFLRLVDLRRIRWRNRVQFFAIAARLMRRVLLDHARRRAALKRSGVAASLPVSDDAAVWSPRIAEILDIEAALEKLHAIDPRLTDIVVLRFFGGMTIQETAGAIGSSPATVKRDWIRARAWLFRELRHLAPPRSQADVDAPDTHCAPGDEQDRSGREQTGRGDG